MNLVSALLTPLALLLPSLGGTDGEASPERTGTPSAQWAAAGETPGAEQTEWPEASTLAEWPYRPVHRSFEPDAAWQVRIEQRLTLRISPRTTMPVRPDIMTLLPSGEIGPQFSERKIGKCVPAGRIAGVQPDGRSRLLLFMRDNRIISAELERGCRARDYYSGFYLAPSEDGMLCVDRDALQSRNGANCKVTRIRQLIETGD